MTVSIKLARGDIGGRDAFKVLNIRNSTVYKPGAVLYKNEVDDLINALRWTVEIVEFSDRYGKLEGRVAVLEKQIKRLQETIK